MKKKNAIFSWTEPSQCGLRIARIGRYCCMELSVARSTANMYACWWYPLWGTVGRETGENVIAGSEEILYVYRASQEVGYLVIHLLSTMRLIRPRTNIGGPRYNYE